MAPVGPCFWGLSKVSDLESAVSVTACNGLIGEE